MVRWICSAKIADRREMRELRCILGLPEIADATRCNRLQWFGHINRMENCNWPRKILDFQIEGRHTRGKPKKRWMDNIREDLGQLGLKQEVAQNRTEWRRAIRPQVHSLDHLVTTSNPDH